MLIHALDNSQNGFSELKRMFNECADAFEIGDDVKGLTVMNQILPSLSDFSNFCADMITTHHHQINDELMNQLTEQCEQFQSLLGDMVAEMEDSNLVEVGDILKYDLGDLVVQISKTFPQIAEALKKDISCVG
ncbi:MAG: hypothetical protein MK132_00370 [Lentisphaerales bacterium]|nr:hypothetical protein [Lentisphaerales bacterium]